MERQTTVNPSDTLVVNRIPFRRNLCLTHTSFRARNKKVLLEKLTKSISPELHYLQTCYCHFYPFEFERYRVVYAPRDRHQANGRIQSINHVHRALSKSSKRRKTSKRQREWAPTIFESFIAIDHHLTRPETSLSLNLLQHILAVFDQTIDTSPTDSSIESSPWQTITLIVVPANACTYDGVSFAAICYETCSFSMNVCVMIVPQTHFSLENLIIYLSMLSSLWQALQELCPHHCSASFHRCIGRALCNTLHSPAQLFSLPSSISHASNW